MKRTTLSLITAALVGAAAHAAAADCTINGTGSVQKYWPSSGTTSSAGNLRCDNSNGTNCHLSGWLYKPTTSGPHAAIVYQTDAAHQEARWDACEIVNYFVAKGYVVFVPYPRGTDDISPHNANMPGEGFHNTGLNWSDAFGTIQYLWTESDDLAAATMWLQGQASVDPHRVAVMGSGVGGVRAAFVSADGFISTPQPLAVIDLSGGVWDWFSSSTWPQYLTHAAQTHNGAILYQEVGNEAPQGDYTPAVTQFTFADNANPAKLALYAPFDVSSSAQTICNNRGLASQRCQSFTFVTDTVMVGRWIDTVQAFLVEYGVQ